MAQHRKFGNTQREAIWRLHEAGLKSPAIAAACAEGRAGLPSFSISGRTVRYLIAEMKAEAEGKLLTSVLDLEHREAMERAPARAARIVKEELDRLEVKAAKQSLTDEEIDRLPRLATYGVRIAKVLEGRNRQQTRRDIARGRAGSQQQPEGMLKPSEGSAPAAREREPQLSRTHAVTPAERAVAARKARAALAQQ